MGRSWVLLGSLACLALAACLTGTRAASAGLELGLERLQDEILVGEPLFVRLQVRNGADQPQTVPTELGYETQMTSYFARRSPDEEWRRLDPGFVQEPVGRTTELEAGGSFVHDQQIFFDHPTGTLAFPEAGAWQLRAVLHRFGREPDLESVPIELRVGVATGADQEPARLFASDPNVREIVMNTGDGADAVPALEAIPRDYPESRFADYARYYLARRASDGFFERAPNPERALVYLEPLRARSLPAPQLEPQVLSFLGLLYERLARLDEAAAVYRTLAKRLPPGSASARATPFLRAFEEREKAAPGAPPARPQGEGSAAPSPIDAARFKAELEAARARPARPSWTGVRLGLLVPAAAIVAIGVLGWALLRRRRAS
jgi:hypothetical protein